MSTIHWDSRNVWGQMPPRAVQLWNIYAAMINRDGVAWPSLAHLTKALCLKDKGAVISARRWLVKHNALEIARAYIPPAERSLPAQHDRRMFVRLTGTVTIEGVTYRLLYAPGEEAGAEVWGGGEIPTIVGKIPLPKSEKSHYPQWEKSHPNVVQEKHGEVVEAPLSGSRFEPPAIRVMANDTALQMNGHLLVQAYAEETKLPAETIWHAGKKVAAGLAKAGITPEDVAGFMREMRTAQTDRYQGYRFVYLAEDLPRWKQNRANKPATGRVLSDSERAAQEAAMEAERVAWRKEQGLS